MNQLPEIPASIKKQLAFSCTFERDRIPPRDPEADQLYKRARWLRRNNLLKKDPVAYPAMERLIRISAAYGHDKANIELQDLLRKGQAVSSDPVNEAVDLAHDLIKRGIPSGYYSMGWYLEHGYGVRSDSELALKYYRKSADLGNPEGQYLVFFKLADLLKNGAEISAIGWEMCRCAGLQGHAKAASMFGGKLQSGQEFFESTKFFQLAAQNGYDSAAAILSDAFGPTGNGDEITRLNQAPDPERQRRYRLIADLLSNYEYLHPSVPEIDEIVPLPPAQLPPWNGSFKWLEEHEANVAPPLPTDERIAEMARAKGLDPQTGRPVGQTR